MLAKGSGGHALLLPEELGEMGGIDKTGFKGDLFDGQARPAKQRLDFGKQTVIDHFMNQHAAEFFSKFIEFARDHAAYPQGLCDVRL